ncbi:M24 family metallopeptidase [Virgibacillus sp. DJP39]|uniref:M24 family metallopeptidase n=1 Tax=Virgibacillus sp. DJP39 TaxID=3409790 RepID=UPI003BB76F59
MYVFELVEFQPRVKKIKQKMQERRIEVLLVTNPSNMNYLTGYNAWSFYVQQMVILFIDEEEPLWLGREMDANSAKLTTWINHERIISYGDEYVQSEFQHSMDFVSDLLIQKGKEEKTIGVEMESHFFSARCLKQLEKNLPDANFFDASTLVNWSRLIKSDQEIGYMKKAAKIVENAMKVGYESVNVGVRECDVAANILHAQIKGMSDFGGDYTAIVPMLPRGKKTNAPHMTWTDETYEHGDPVILELAGCYKRYHSPLARTMVLGKASGKLIDLSKVVVEGLNKVLSTIKPGMTSEQVEAVWRTSIAKHGYKKDSRIGYSVGLSYPPDWGEHTISVRNGDQTIIEPNMCLHLIPGIWFDDFGFEVSEAIHITETGCEMFADFPRELYIKA